MKIGIIGAGNIGVIVARKLTANGHEIKLANSKEPDTIEDLSREIRATAVSTEEVAQGVETIVLSIPFGKYPDLASLFNDMPADVVVIDTSNYYPFRDGAIAEVDGGKPESIWDSEQIGRRVTKAWNAVLAATLAKRDQPKGAPERIAILVAGDGPKAKATTMELLEATGFDALVSGGLGDSWRQQPGTLAYCTELTASELKSALVSRPVSRARQSRRPPQGIHGGRR